MGGKLGKGEKIRQEKTDGEVTEGNEMDTVTLARMEQEKQCNEMDTVTLARMEREKQAGPWEVEVSYGGEADLHQHLINCVKNLGHQTFLPVDQFNVDHLPPGCRDNDLVDYIRAMSDLTVRVSVKYVSERRPEFAPGSDKPYPTYKFRGRNMMRTGTGWVCRVGKYPNKRDSSTTCECQECLDSTTPKTQFAKIHIQTAAHVVYDELEAAHTTCHLFYDKGDSPRDCSGVLELSDWYVEGRGEGDWCHMVHETHDLDLADLLHKMTDRCDNLRKNVSIKYGLLNPRKQISSSPSEYLPEAWEKLYNRYRRLMSGEQASSSSSEFLPEAWDKLTIIVSHPHGCSKQVSVGYYNYRGENEDSLIQPHYTTSTCPGSSGAPVIVLEEDTLWFWNIDVHRGNYREKRQLNFQDFAWL